MQSIDLKAMEKFIDDLNDLLDDIPNARRELHEEMAKLLKTEVDEAIISSGIQDTSGKVRSWQEARVGSGGGYAAIRPTDSSVGPNSPGAITNYLEHGHRIRRPSGNAKRYRPKIRVPYVDGRHFYQSASRTIEPKAIALAEQFAEKLAKRIEGD